MEDVIQQLEARIHKLLQESQELKNTNFKLKQSRAILLKEKELLLSKHKNTIHQIEDILSRLKLIEIP